MRWNHSLEATSSRILTSYSDCYVLRNRTPVKVDAITWARWLDAADAVRLVERTVVRPGVSATTAFYGIDGRFFETEVDGGLHDGHREESATWAEAQVSHRRAVA